MRDPKAILQEHWGHPDFRPLQGEIVASILQGHDTLALLPTGGGKSVCFQVPGLALPGLTLVVSPLIALMRDQVENLNSRHIPATYVNSSLSWREIDRKLQMAMEGKYKFLYIAPERLETEIFLARLPAMNVSLVAIDEAHCISQWGYDFRPSYLRIHTLRTHLPRVPFAAFTATAPPKVREDIVDKLAMRSPQVFTKSFRRDNLSYRVIESEHVAERLLQFVRNNEGAGIIYARTRKRVQALADLLKREGVPSAAYHGGLGSAERSRVQSLWIKNELRVIAATNAFGMGIDKPDVRFVLHFNMPSDLESYYQEAGRAGRDGKPCVAACFRNPQDMAELRTWVEDRYPTWEQLLHYYEVLCNHFGVTNEAPPPQAFPLDTGAIAKQSGAHPMRLHNAIRIFDQTGVLALDERPEDFASLMMLVPPEHVLMYKQRFPAQAAAIDHILRSLGGEVYSDAVRFLPGPFAAKAGIPEAEMKRQLEQLSTRGIIAFEPAQTEPTIRFLGPRVRLNKQVLGWDKYEFLKAQAMQRLERVEAYLEVPGESCRSMQLERYFGEDSRSECGVCDWCRAKAAGPLDTKRLSGIAEELMALVGAGEKDIRDILERGVQGTRNQRLEVLRQLMDAGKLLRVGPLRVKRP